MMVSGVIVRVGDDIDWTFNAFPLSEPLPQFAVNFPLSVGQDSTFCVIKLDDGNWTKWSSWHFQFSSHILLLR